MSDLENEVFSKLKRNDSSIFEETTRLLIKIATNILKEPDNLQIRTLQKNNKTVKTKILAVSGGSECLKLMGFIEKDACYTFPERASLHKLQQLKTTIETLQQDVRNKPSTENVFAALKEDADASGNISDSTEDTTSTSSEDTSKDEPQELQTSVSNIPAVILPPIFHMFNNPFLREIEEGFHRALSYQDKDLLERARKIIPLKILEDRAQNRLRHLQEQVKKGKLADPEISLQEMLLLELLSWFKNDFFSWVDKPDCTFCGGKTSFIGMNTDPSLLIRTHRVEMYTCNTCQKSIPFPRYNDVNILLVTRKGRCGEWANTFTLLCFAMGWDARFIQDQTDHVWTEVYSFAQKRWLHCDPCENVCDTPLMYESGWKKQVSYILAYSPEEVQDVTWRYSSDHKAVLKRRKKCSEQDLINALLRLREMRQTTFSDARKNYLKKRLVLELVELMKERKPTDSEKEGRTSGSIEWRLARRETEIEFVPYTWIMSEEDCKEKTVIIQYSAALDNYEKWFPHCKKLTLNGWSSGAFDIQNVFRKEEKDWKMVYLARQEGTDSASICWKFSLNSEKMVFDTVHVKFLSTTFENGEVSIRICSEDTCFTFPKGQTCFKTTEFSGLNGLIIKACLSGGKGTTAWQHSQLFRQEMNSKEFPFVVTFTFKSKS